MSSNIYCAICGESRRVDEDWFLLTENRWTDRLRVLAYHPLLAEQEGVFCVCGTPHVRELVLHWMITGHLDYPFAQTGSEVPSLLRPSSTPGTTCAEPDISASLVVGELAVHRESLTRVLCENPESLSGVLEAVIAALNRGPAPLGCSCIADEAEPVDSTELVLTNA